MVPRSPLSRPARGRSPSWLAALVVALVWGLLAAVCAVSAQPRSDVPRLAPADAPSVVTVAGDDEPGERLTVHGKVLTVLGEPVPGASVFVYQTGEDGIYGPEGNRNPRLRGYLRTDEAGGFELRTIKPGSYPGSSIAAHIHIHVTPPDGAPEKVGEIVFEGDPRLTERMRRQEFFTVVELEAGEGGLTARYEMRLDEL